MHDLFIADIEDHFLILAPRITSDCSTLDWPIKFKDSLGSLSYFGTLDWPIKFKEILAH